MYVEATAIIISSIEHEAGCFKSLNLWCACMEALNYPASAPEQKATTKAKDFIIANLASDITIDDIANVANMSSTFIRALASTFALLHTNMF